MYDITPDAITIYCILLKWDGMSISQVYRSTLLVSDMRI